MKGKTLVGGAPDPGWTIYVLPGEYNELPSANQPLIDYCRSVQADSTRESGIGTIADPTKQPAKTRDGTPVAISYADQVRCPHNLNLIAIFGDSTPDDASHACNNSLCGLQLEGTGGTPSDVLIDNRFSKLNGIRTDRTDGIYFRNFLIQQAEFNSLYVMETDG